MEEEKVEMAVPTEEIEPATEEVVEVTLKEMRIAKEREMKEKYAEVINDLCIKYDRTVDFGFEALKAIARAKMFNEEPMYESNIEFNLDELVADEKELLELCEKC